jgi:hypothetical protein
VVAADDPLDRLPDEIVEAVQWIWSHGAPIEPYGVE